MPRVLISVLAVLVLTFPAAAATLEQMAGQMIVVGFEGDGADDDGVEAVTAELAAGRLGGVMYLKKNVADLASVREMNARFRAAAPDLPAFITLDQEGGSVERLTRDVGFKEIPNAASIAANHSPLAAERIYGEMARAIAAEGFTVNFGPVADLGSNPDNQIIARFGRAFSAEADIVAAYDEAFIRAHHHAGLITALKHFPGHGSSTADSHEGFVNITRTWKPEELEPYRTLIGAGLVDMVMVGHLYHADYAEGDGETPSSLSPRWIDGVLRDELGFDGVVISDDLEMAAIRDHFTLEETVTRAVRAGMDVLLFSNTAKYRPGLSGEVLDILLAEAEADPAFAARIEESYGRIVALKARIE
ncbi:glycoside hydrolase family 3 N-terminal domain-containing protein [Devosia sp. YIM 151766]|uniref:glycoside hydrolase family 3 N-terminal domain-containing protein n=1 Tax=Devosia sp. YIM 151766 TaxID=3017325 RepID=UPI00255C754A|nr:glycoside hydrolase family 3 N-terminal domain-containing protein [Devosia sp. YIM 151766]WIY51674.1 glycoside hydrolase family 3 N-terminal domain-containing protein [Devosia sp. YIM 151766]